MSHFQMLMNVLIARYAVKGFVKTPMVHIVASVTRGTKTHWMGKGVWVSCQFLTPVLELEYKSMHVCNIATYYNLCIISCNYDLKFCLVINLSISCVTIHFHAALKGVKKQQ